MVTGTPSKVHLPGWVINVNGIEGVPFPLGRFNMDLNIHLAIRSKLFQI